MVDHRLSLIMALHVVRYFSLKIEFISLCLTHSLTHNRKKWDGNERSQEQGHADYSQRKAHERLGNQHFFRFDTLRNQQVACSSHVTSSKTKDRSLDRSFFLYGASAPHRGRQQASAQNSCRLPFPGSAVSSAVP